MIRHGDIRRAEHIIDTAGIVDIIESGVRRSPRGRPAKVNNLRLLLLGMFLSVHHGGSAAITDIHRTLTEELPLDQQYRLKIRTHDGNTAREVSYRNLEYQAARLMKALSYGPGSTSTVPEAERIRRREVVTTALNALMDVFDLGWATTSLAIDATGIWSWAKSPRKDAPVGSSDGVDLDAESAALLAQARETGIIPERLVRITEARRAKDLDEMLKEHAQSAAGTGDDESGQVAALIPPGKGKSHDPDAAYGVKTSKKGRDEVFYGYHEHTLVLADVRGATDGAPPLIRRMELTPASVDVVDVSLRLLDSLPAPPKLLIGDLHYSYKKAERWQLPLVGRGIRQVHDIRVDEHGFIEYQRMRFAAGRAHCPSTPDALDIIPKPGPISSHEVWDFFHNEIDRRQPYAMRVVNQVNASGAIRYQCPAVAGTVGCPLRAGSVESALENGGIPLIENPPVEVPGGEPLPACCTQETVLVRPPDEVVKLAQPYYWGSREWRANFNKRTYVEGSYGNRKNPSTENMRRGIFRCVGVVWANIVIGMAAASYNLRMLQNWHKRTDEHGDHPLLLADEKHHGFVYLTAEQAALIALASSAEAAA